MNKNRVWRLSPGWRLCRDLAATMLAATVLLPACASTALVGAMDEGAASITGQTLVFVGTDPETLRTDLYLVHSQNNSRLAGDGSLSGPELGDDVEFNLDPIDSFATRQDGSPLLGDGDSLFSEQTPFPVPDRLGTRLAVLATSVDGDGNPGPGRVAVLRIVDRSSLVTPDVDGLRGVRFTWDGGYLVLSATDVAAGSIQRTWLQPADGPWDQPPREVRSADGRSHVEFAGLIRGGEQFFVRAIDPESGRSELHRVDPTLSKGEDLILDASCAGGGAPCTLITGALITDPADSAFDELDPLHRSVEDPQLSPSGQYLALTLNSDYSNAGLRDVAIIDLDDPDAEVIVASASLGLDCYWPSWSPALGAGGSQVLSFVCFDAANERPDILLWDTASQEPERLTAGAQPEVPGGSMDGSVIRSHPRWNPSGDFLVFGASTVEDAYQGSDVTLLGMNSVDQQAYPLYTGPEGVEGWAHFSSEGDGKMLLLWDRSETGLEDTAGWPHQPIRAVRADEARPETVFVTLGRDLWVSYPQFLGGNSRYYP